MARFLVLVALSRVAVSRACSRVLARRSDRDFASVVAVFLAGLAVILLRFAEISPRLSPLVRRVRPRFLPLFCLQFATSVAVFFRWLMPEVSLLWSSLSCRVSAITLLPSPVMGRYWVTFSHAVLSESRRELAHWSCGIRSKSPDVAWFRQDSLD